MECPVCLSAREVRSRIMEAGLRAWACDDCGGHWIRAVDYWFWRAGRGRIPRMGSPQEISGIAVDRPLIKLCPEDRTVLERYRVGTGDSITVDRCARCSGVWLDAKEWEILGAHDLHLHLHDLLSPTWQDELRSAELAAAEPTGDATGLEPEDLRRIEEMRGWLESHPLKRQLWAILQQAGKRSAAAG